jgi:hypothetical protein
MNPRSPHAARFSAFSTPGYALGGPRRVRAARQLSETEGASAVTHVSNAHPPLPFASGSGAACACWWRLLQRVLCGLHVARCAGARTREYVCV